MNPRAGRGLAPAYAEAIGAALRERGFEPVVRETEKDAIRLPEEIERAIVVGGDGTLRRAAASLGEVGVPFLHALLGTENLFARMLGLPREPEDIAELAVRGGTRKIDAGRTPHGPFTLMVSVGFDAEVIHDLHARRRGPIRHASYIGPIVRTTLKRKWPKVSVEVDGSLWLTNVEAWPSWPIFLDTHSAVWIRPVMRSPTTDSLMWSSCRPHRSPGRCCGHGVLGRALRWIIRPRWWPVVLGSRCRALKNGPPIGRRRGGIAGWGGHHAASSGVRSDCAFALRVGQLGVTRTSRTTRTDRTFRGHEPFRNLPTGLKLGGLHPDGHQESFLL